MKNDNYKLLAAWQLYLQELGYIAALRSVSVTADGCYAIIENTKPNIKRFTSVAPVWPAGWGVRLSIADIHNTNITGGFFAQLI